MSVGCTYAAQTYTPTSLANFAGRVLKHDLLDIANQQEAYVLGMTNLNLVDDDISELSQTEKKAKVARLLKERLCKSLH